MNQFWKYSLTVYDRPEVSQACLYLQDKHGVDVNLLLYCAWQGSRGLALVGEGLAPLDAQLQRWRERIIKPIRALRRDFAGETEAADLYEQLKQLELQAEQAQQEQLFAMDVALETRTDALQRNFEALEQFYTLENGALDNLARLLA